MVSGIDVFIYARYCRYCTQYNLRWKNKGKGSGSPVVVDRHVEVEGENRSLEAVGADVVGCADSWVGIDILADEPRKNSTVGSPAVVLAASVDQESQYRLGT